MFRTSDRQKCDELFKRHYAGRKFHDTCYREMIRKHIAPGHHVLDAGCGRYLKFCRELSGTARVVGIDLDSVLETDNRSAPFGIRGDVGRLPFPPGIFDVVISRSVIEHLADPAEVFREFSRVLRPGGKVVLITPNKYDYVSMIAAITPYRVHRWLVSKIFRVPEDDVFPTLYRANTVRAIRKALRGAGLVECEMTAITHYPAYLMFSPVLFRAGMLYERLTGLKGLEFLRASILCVFEKPALADSVPSGRAHHKAQIGVA